MQSRKMSEVFPEDSKSSNMHHLFSISTVSCSFSFSHDVLSTDCLEDNRLKINQFKKGFHQSSFLFDRVFFCSKIEKESQQRQLILFNHQVKSSQAL